MEVYSDGRHDDVGGPNGESLGEYGPEQAFHRAAARFLDLALPDDATWFHPANGGARRRKEAAILSGLGVKAGIPDLIVVHRGRLIAVELKAPGGRLTPAQKAMHRRLALAGAVVTTVTSLDELASFLAILVPLRATVAA